MSSVFSFGWLAVNSSVSFWIAFFNYFPLVIDVFFYCYFRITRRFMLRSKNELNIFITNETDTIIENIVLFDVSAYA